MGGARFSNGEWISCGSATLLFAFMFLRWYDSVLLQSNLLGALVLFNDAGGNAWQTLELIPVFLVLVIAVTFRAALLRANGLNRKSPMSSGLVVCALGVLAAILILVRILAPPDLAVDFGAASFEVTPKTGIYLALAAACGVALGGYRAWREERADART